MLKGKHSYRQQFTYNSKGQRKPLPNSKGQREPLPPHFRCAKLVIALLSTSSKMPIVITEGN